MLQSANSPVELPFCLHHFFPPNPSLGIIDAYLKIESNDMEIQIESIHRLLTDLLAWMLES